MSPVRADEVLKALSIKHAEDVFLTEVKTGPTWTARREELKRIDGVAIKKSWAQPCITAYEVKVSRNDFLNDEKWPRYREFCHRLYFACPSGLIHPEELAEDVGLVWYSPETKGLVTRKKALYRNIEIPAPMLYYMLLYRTESDRHPFFSQQREYLEAWVTDKQDRQRLGYLVKSKLFQETATLETVLKEKERLGEANKTLSAHIEAVSKLLTKHGIYLSGYNSARGLENGIKELDKALSRGVPKNILYSIQQIAAMSDQLVKQLEEKSDPEGGEKGA